MSNAPFISVMILCYNCAHLVGKALNAVAMQSFQDFELVFIDNGSTDNSVRIYENFIENHPEITSELVSVQENQGPTHGWNEGLKRAHGEYIIFNDADDWMDSSCLQELAAKARETGADRITGQYREITLEGRVIRERRISLNCLPTAMLQGTIFRRSVIENKGLSFPEKDNLVAYDFEMVYRFAKSEDNRGSVVRKTLYNYLVHSASVIQNSTTAEKAITYLDNVTKPLIDMTNQVASDCTDRELADRMIYLVTRNYYPRILTLYQKMDRETAEKISMEMRNYMNEKLPAYRKNRFLRPFLNGYEQPGSLVVWMLSIFERFNMLDWVARVVSQRVQKTKYFR